MRIQDISRDAAAYFVQWSSVPRSNAVNECTPLRNTCDLHTRHSCTSRATSINARTASSCPYRDAWCKAVPVKMLQKNTEGRAMGVPPLLPLPAGAMQSTSAPSSMSLQMPSMLPSAAAATRPSFNFTSTALPNAGQTVLLCDYQQQTRTQADNLQAQQRSQRHRVDETNRWR